MKRIAALVILVVALTGLAGVATTDAKALNPSRTTAAGVRDAVLSDLTTFWTTAFRQWGWSYLWRNTGVGFYHPGPYTGYASACGSTSGTFYVNNAAYCTNDFSIYADQTWLQSLLNRYGDGGPAMILAHEFGHHVGHLQGRFLGKDARERELNADCLAGMYFRWGVQYSGVLNYNDYLEARNLVWYELGSDPAGHGTSQVRLAWFDYGFSAYDISSCNSVFSY
jgi:predicted metalloprotease